MRAVVVFTDACWLWGGRRLPRGYGVLRIGRKMLYAHRAAWATANGPIPSGLFVCHRCDNPPCVRPDHLYLGTAADNMHDRDQRGRGRWGPNRPSARS